MDNIEIITSALAGSARRGELIANNLANVSTPGYKRQDIDFKSALKKEMDSASSVELKTTQNNHLAFSRQYSAVQNSENSRISRNDGNSVDIEVEMAELAKNSIYYNVMTNRAAGHFSTLNQVIQQGGK
ncbi:flagellar basal body rod protein FlgB [Halanaerobium saccharolyticum]|jgi:flagellar basal-body rod protein FlgB|uniref:Flagellar basal body rod protein FlgB n=1 Tax=Halanaerobium saccharolyticum TaxID=43595 RepID=A0A2T5RGL9_9FIRM|nr:flagellar basal body rod protein FlgB [Halanaerobium saccharolyticum]OEG62946.1 MAG: flagellar basal-body rod protein FlgB [Halanaerobium sp. MDAL1]PTV93833.1 flagellar basal-body rod protein FlgB [Halanaerobium saccharolyticum]